MNRTKLALLAAKQACRSHTDKAAVALVTLFLAQGAFAQTNTNPLTSALSSIDLTTVGTAIGALVVLIIGIAMAFKGGDVGKRAVRKV